MLGALAVCVVETGCRCWVLAVAVAVTGCWVPVLDAVDKVLFWKRVSNEGI